MKKQIVTIISAIFVMATMTSGCAARSSSKPPELITEFKYNDAEYKGSGNSGIHEPRPTRPEPDAAIPTMETVLEPEPLPEATRRESEPEPSQSQGGATTEEWHEKYPREIRDRVRAMAAEFPGDILGAYNGTPLLPGFDVSLIETDGTWSGPQDGSTGIVFENEKHTMLVFYCDDLSAIYGYHAQCTTSDDVIRKYGMDDCFSFNDLHFGASMEEVLQTYGLATNEQYKNNGFWRLTWGVEAGQYRYEFEISGNDGIGMTSVTLRPDL